MLMQAMQPCAGLQKPPILPFGLIVGLLVDDPVPKPLRTKTAFSAAKHKASFKEDVSVFDYDLTKVVL